MVDCKRAAMMFSLFGAYKVMNKNSEHSSVMCGKHKNNVRG